ncbi:MAG TPA: rhodanese-like domain-containing protein [Pyrinomonadaceae bacterium]|nr:rhodanese-like domain-containing protein [Pyrinomonadaceae bacterium]
MKMIGQLCCGAAVVALALLGVGCLKSNPSANQTNGAVATLASNSTATTAETQTPANPEDKMPRVKVQDAMKEVADGKALIIDVRGTEAYKMAHIKGSRDYPLPKIESKDFNGLPKDKHIIAYCT